MDKKTINFDFFSDWKPKLKIAFMLLLCEAMLEKCLSKHDNPKEITKVISAALNKGWSWLYGDINDVSILTYEVYNDNGTDISEYQGLQDKDFDIVGNMVITTLLFTGLQQHLSLDENSMPDPFWIVQSQDVGEVFFGYSFQFDKEMQLYFYKYVKQLHYYFLTSQSN